MRSIIAISSLTLLAACVSSKPPTIYTPPVERTPTSTTTATPPPPQAPRQAPPQTTSGFVAPEVMNLPGLERVIGSSPRQLERLFGKPRLETPEGDMRKLQFGGEPCVLDVYLYPLRPGAAPTATHVEARRASDGREVDRASCVRALSIR